MGAGWSLHWARACSTPWQATAAQICTSDMELRRSVPAFSSCKSKHTTQPGLTCCSWRKDRTVTPIHRIDFLGYNPLMAGIDWIMIVFRIHKPKRHFLHFKIDAGWIMIDLKLYAVQFRRQLIVQCFTKLCGVLIWIFVQNDFDKWAVCMVVLFYFLYI